MCPEEFRLDRIDQSERESGEVWGVQSRRSCGGPGGFCLRLIPIQANTWERFYESESGDREVAPRVADREATLGIGVFSGLG